MMINTRADLIPPETIPYEWAKKELVLDRSYRLGDNGPKVKKINEWLNFHHFDVAINQDFSNATETAVKNFQGKMGLPVNGVLNAATFQWLTEAMLRALTPLPAEGKTYNDLIVGYARQHLNDKDYPREIGGNNLGPWVRLYLKGSEDQWCAGFVSFILLQAAKTLNQTAPLPYIIGCDALGKEARKKGILVLENDLNETVIKQMPPGSIFLTKSNSKGKIWTHTGLVTEFQADRFKTIEGNSGHNSATVCSHNVPYSGYDFIKISI